MNRHALVLLVLASGIGALAPRAAADEILLVNGDRLSGRVVSLVEGTLTLESELLGTLEVDASSIEKLATSGPVEIHAPGGTVLNDVAVMGDPGELRTAGRSAVGPQTFRLAEVEAINPPAQEPPRWHGDLKAGLNFQRGNSFQDEGDFGLDARRESDRDRIRMRAAYEGERVRDTETGESTTNERKIEGELKYDYFLGERWYWYGRSQGTKDGVQELDLRFEAGGGYGYRWLKTERTSLDVELGLNWISEHYEDSANDEEYLGAILSWSLRRRLTDTLRLFSDVDWLVDAEEWDDRFVIDAELGLRDYLTRSLFLEARVEWDYNAEPASGAERIDTEYVFSLGYEF